MSSWESLDELCAEFTDLSERLRAAVEHVLPAGTVVRVPSGTDTNFPIIGIVHDIADSPETVKVVLEHGDVRSFSVRDVCSLSGTKLPRWVKDYLKRNG